MRTFLKVVLILIALLLAIKLLPLTLVAGAIIGAAAFVIGLLGLSVAATLFCVAAAAAVLLSPLWLPVALIIGIVALCRRKKPATI